MALDQHSFRSDPAPSDAPHISDDQNDPIEAQDQADEFTSSEEDESLDESVSRNSTGLLAAEMVEAERTVAFVLITIFSVLCATMATVALVIFIVYYKRNIAKFSKGRVFAQSIHRRMGSHGVRLLRDESKTMEEC